MTQTVLTAAHIKDTYLAEASNTTNFGTSSNLLCGNTRIASNDRANRVHLWLDLLGAIGDGQFIDSLTVTLKDLGDGSGAAPTPLIFHANMLTKVADADTSTWLSPWATPGGDYTVTDADTAILATAASDLTFSNLGDIGHEAYVNWGGKLGLLIRGPEGVGENQFNAFGSFNNVSPALHPVVTVTHHASVHMQFAAATKTLIESLDLEGSPTVLVRKIPVHRRATIPGMESDPNPAIILSTHLPTTHTPATNLSDEVVYPVTVNFYSGSDGSPTLNHGRMLAWREIVRKAFHQKRLSGATSVAWTCNIPPSAPFNEGALNMGMRDVSPLTLNFVSREQRN